VAGFEDRLDGGPPHWRSPTAPGSQLARCKTHWCAMELARPHPTGRSHVEAMATQRRTDLACRLAKIGDKGCPKELECHHASIGLILCPQLKAWEPA